MLTTLSAAVGTLCMFAGFGLANLYAHFLADEAGRRMTASR